MSVNQSVSVDQGAEGGGLAVWVGALNHGSAATRLAAVRALGAIGPAARGATEQLVRLLLDKRVRQAVAATIGRIGPDPEVLASALLDYLRDTDAGGRSEAIHGLLAIINWSARARPRRGNLPRIAYWGERATTLIFSGLRGVLTTADADTYGLVFEILGHLDLEDKDLTPIITEGIGAKDVAIRSKAIAALESFDSEVARRFVPALLNHLSVEKKGKVWDLATHVLSSIGLTEPRFDPRPGDPPVPVSPLQLQAVSVSMKALQARDPAIRKAAVFLLGCTGPAAVQAVGALAAVVRADRSDDVRIDAMRALGEMGETAQTAVPALVAVLEEGAGEFSRNPNKCWLLFQVVSTLAEIGRGAKPALPHLLRLRGNRQLTRHVDEALRHIAPESYAHAILLSSDPEATPALSSSSAATQGGFPEGLDTLGNVPQLLQVEVSVGDDSFLLLAEGVKPFSIESDMKALFGLFFNKILAGAPQEIVGFTPLNKTVDLRNESEADRASDALRKALFDLNHTLKKKWARTPDGEPWIRTKKGQGYYLNSSVTWTVSPNARRLFRRSGSLRARPTDPTTLEENTPRPDDHLPTRRRGKPQRDEDRKE